MIERIGFYFLSRRIFKIRYGPERRNAHPRLIVANDKGDN
jgi:hypothetical protein